MPIDSTADLLFRIGANSDDAESNLVRFRSLLSKDMSDITGEFGDWSNKIIGQVTTLQGAVTAGAAILAAGIVALGAFANEATNKYVEYVGEVARGSKTTGIAVEAMSGLKFAAEATNTSYDALVGGLTKFATTIVKAAEGGATQQAMFDKLGISQEHVKAGEKDMLPLLMEVSDKFRALSSHVEQTAISRDLFARGGTELVNFLRLGSKGMPDLMERAKELGLTISALDVNQMKDIKASLRAMKEQSEALDITIARSGVPTLTVYLRELYVGWVKATIATLEERSAIESLTDPIGTVVEFTQRWIKEIRTLQDDAQKQQLITEAQGNAELKHAQTAAKVNVEFSEFSRLLQEIRTKAADAGGAESKLTEEILKLQNALVKAGLDYEKLREKGGQSAAQIAQQLRIFTDAQAAFTELVPELWAKLREKQAEGVAAAGAELRQMLLRQGTQTADVQRDLFGLEMLARKEKLDKEVGDKAAAYQLLAEYTKAGFEKIDQAEKETIAKEGADIEALTESQAERTYAQKVAHFNKEVDLWRDKLAAEEHLDADMEEKVAAYRTAGLAKIERVEGLAFAAEINRLSQQLETISKKHETAAQAIQSQYLVDVGKFGAAEEAKASEAAHGEAERAQTAQKYAAIRAGLLTKEIQDLQALRNSAGWQGVFGSQFAQMIKGNEALTREWATSTNQSLLMVKVTMEALKEQGQQMFQTFSQGMGSGITDAIIYKKSVGEAMQAAMTSTLASIAARALTSAIYATGMGFWRLAEHDYPGATAAFESAAIFGSIAGAAAVTGRAIAPSQAAATASAGGAGSTAAGSSAAGSTGAQGAGGPKVTVNVYGHIFGVSGIEEVASALSDAVINRNITLTASSTTFGNQLFR